jgi:hypothetical protein
VRGELLGEGEHIRIHGDVAVLLLLCGQVAVNGTMQFMQSALKRQITKAFRFTIHLHLSKYISKKIDKGISSSNIVQLLYMYAK